MPIEFRCPACDSATRAPDRLAGRRLPCPRCGERILVPQATQTPPRKAATPAAPPAPPPAEEDDEPIDLNSKREDIEAEMDMTPMVDVTFLLLIFFMVTAAFSLQKSIEIPKPAQDDPSTNAVQQDPENDPECVTVFVDEFNTYRVVSEDWDVEAPSEQEMLRRLREARNGGSSGTVPTRLLVKAHVDSIHEKVVAALDAGTEVGMEQIQLATVEEIE